MSTGKGPPPAVGGAGNEPDRAMFRSDEHPPPQGWRRSSKALLLVVILATVAVLVVALVANFLEVRHWLAEHTGLLHAGPDPYYNFWSGIGSDLGEITLLSAVVLGAYTGVKRVNCHSRGCWRIGRYHLEGTPYVLCRHHHPDVPNRGASHQHIMEAYRRKSAGTDAAAGTRDSG